MNASQNRRLAPFEKLIAPPSAPRTRTFAIFDVGDWPDHVRAVYAGAAERGDWQA
jgi:hypothetical protein